MKSTIHKIIVITLSIVIVAVIATFGDKILNLALTPLPENIKSCLSQKFSNDVNAQAACTGISSFGSVAVWDERSGNAGKLRESNFYVDTNPLLTPIPGRITHTGAQGIRLQNTNAGSNFGFISSEATLHLTSNEYYDTSGTPAWRSIGAGRTGGIFSNAIGNVAMGVFANDTALAGPDLTTAHGNVMTVGTNGNVTVGTAGFGDARLSINGSNALGGSLLDSALVARSGATTAFHAFSVLPWASGTFIGSGVYYNNGAWTQSGPVTASTVSSASMLFLNNTAPGGANWYYDDDTTLDWDVSGGTQLWNNIGTWTGKVSGDVSGSLKYGNVTVDVDAVPNYIQQASSTTVVGTKYYYSGTTLSGSVYGDSAGFSLLNSAGVRTLYIPPASTTVTVPAAVSAGSYAIGGVTAITGDTYLRLNQGLVYSNGVYTQGAFRADGASTFNNQVTITNDLFVTAGNSISVSSGTGPTMSFTSTGTGSPTGYSMSVNGTGAASEDVIHAISPATGNFKWNFNNVNKMNLTSAGVLTIPAGTVAVTSDERLKKDMVPLDSSLDKILKLEGISFNWKDNSLNTHDGLKTPGFSAQRIEKVIPELVYTDDKGYKSVSYQNFAPYLVNAVKELYAKFEQLVARVTTVENKQAQQEELIKKQQQQINTLEKRLEKLEQK